MRFGKPLKAVKFWREDWAKWLMFGDMFEGGGILGLDEVS